MSVGIYLFNLKTVSDILDHTVPGRPQCIQNLKTLAQIGAEKYVTYFFLREKEKWTNKGTDKQYVALLHNTTCHYQALYQISES